MFFRCRDFVTPFGMHAFPLSFYGTVSRLGVLQVAASVSYLSPYIFAKSSKYPSVFSHVQTFLRLEIQLSLMVPFCAHVRSIRRISKSHTCNVKLRRRR